MSKGLGGLQVDILATLYNDHERNSLYKHTMSLWMLKYHVFGVLKGAMAYNCGPYQEPIEVINIKPGQASNFNRSIKSLVNRGLIFEYSANGKNRQFKITPNGLSEYKRKYSLKNTASNDK